MDTKNELPMFAVLLNTYLYASRLNSFGKKLYPYFVIEACEVKEIIITKTMGKIISKDINVNTICKSLLLT